MKNVVKLAVASIIASSSVAHADWIDDIEAGMAQAGLTSLTAAQKNQILGAFSFSDGYIDVLEATKVVQDCFASGNFSQCSQAITDMKTAVSDHGTDSNFDFSATELDKVLWGTGVANNEGIIGTAAQAQLTSIENQVTSTSSHATNIINYYVDNTIAGTNATQRDAGLNILSALLDTDVTSADVTGNSSYGSYVVISTTDISQWDNTKKLSHNSANKLLSDYANALGHSVDGSLSLSDAKSHTTYANINASSDWDESADSIRLTYTSTGSVSNTISSLAGANNVNWNSTNDEFSSMGTYEATAIQSNFTGWTSSELTATASHTLIDITNIYATSGTSAPAAGSTANVWNVTDFQ